MLCPSCGTDNTPDRKYCGMCGHFLAQPAPAGKTAPIVAPPNYPQPSPAIQQMNTQVATPPPAPVQEVVAPRVATSKDDTARLKGALLEDTARLTPRAAEPGASPEAGLFADAFRSALVWRPLSLLTLGFFASTVVYLFSMIISSVIIGAMARGGSTMDGIGAAAFVLTLLTLLAVYLVEMVFMSATTKICYERQITGQTLTRLEAMKFTFANAGPVIIAPFLFVLVAVVVFFFEWLIFLLGSIESVGSIVTGIFFAPFVVLNTALFFIINYAIWMALINVAGGTRGVGETLSKTIGLVKQSARAHVPELLSLTLVQILMAVFAVVVVACGFFLTVIVAQAAGAAVGVEAIIDGRIARLLDRLVLGSPSSPGFRTSEPPIFGTLLGLLTMAGGLSLVVGMMMAVPRLFFVNGCIRVYSRLVGARQ